MDIKDIIFINFDGLADLNFTLHYKKDGTKYRLYSYDKKNNKILINKSLCDFIENCDRKCNKCLKNVMKQVMDYETFKKSYGEIEEFEYRENF